ncbi:hypothetical protein ACWEPM_12240 [Streptomyces sp. NPDC004244]|uniref:hypothetical protein n=1 Tax=Streptomyces sp. NPDC101206 TaxID=3366128 RepID=UPI003816AF88
MNAPRLSEPYEDHGGSADGRPGGPGDDGLTDATALPSTAGLFLLAVGGLLLTTTRPWDKPGHPALLALVWAAALAMLAHGAALTARCVRAVHAADAPPPEPPTPPQTPSTAPYEDGAGRSGENPARPA